MFLIFFFNRIIVVKLCHADFRLRRSVQIHATNELSETFIWCFLAWNVGSVYSFGYLLILH